MTGEISSLMQSLLSSSRELPEQTAGRIEKGQAVAGPQQVAGNARPDSALEDGESRPEDKQPLEGDALNGTISDLNSLAQQMHRELRFSLDDESGEMVIKVIDKETDQVLRQIPSQEVLELRQRLTDAVGVFFRDSV